MAKITKCYNYRNKLNAEGKTQIVIRISVGKEKKYFNIGYWIEPHFWDEKKAEVKKKYQNFQKINQRLNGKVAVLQKEIELTHCHLVAYKGVEMVESKEVLSIRG